jgi:hypothetical protein
MKTFRQFISEARETQASQMAKQKGLRGNGHGDWYDATGKLVAKTVSGELKFFGGKTSAPIDTKVEKAPKEVQYNQPTNTTQKSNTSGGGKGVVALLGRFNPPSKGHEQMLKYGMSRANESGFEYRVYPSRIQDSGTDPINPSLKVQYMQMMYPEYADYILDSEESKTVFDVLRSLYNDGYREVKLVVGAERLGEFQSIVHKSDGQGYEFDNLEVMPSPGKDPDSDVSGAGSSAALRTAAMNGDYNAFSSSLPAKMKPVDKEELFNSVVKSMTRGNKKESLEMWRVAPELDMKTIREEYRTNNLYELGTLVENLNTGLVGEVKRRGTNYLICVTEDGIMFKSWLQNVRAVTEDVYEVGTDKYREFLQNLTPGQPKKAFTEFRIKETLPKTINKIRKQFLKLRK